MRKLKKAKAIKPAFFANIPSLAKDKEAEKKGATEEERLLYSMAGTAGWRVLSEWIDELLDDLDNISNVAIDSGMGFEEIGRNTVVVNLAKSVIKKVVNRVEDAVEACEQPNEK